MPLPSGLLIICLINRLITLWEFPCMLIVFFPLVAFNILSLSLIFIILIAMCLCVFLLAFILPGNLHFLDLIEYFLSHVREVFCYYLCKYYLGSFLSSPSGTPIMQMLVCLMLSQRSLRLSSVFFFFIFFLYSVLQQ